MATSRTRRLPLLCAAALLTLTGAGCTKVDNALAKVPVFAFMHDAPSFDPYEHPLPPPPGTVPFAGPGSEALPPLQGTEAALQAFASSEHGINPYSPADPAIVTQGQVMYERHCSVCHGPAGAGDGPLVGENKYPQGFVPPVSSGNAVTLSDGYIYAVVRAGRARMPAYGPRMTHEERWAVVNYVRVLQNGGRPVQAATPADTADVPADTAAAPQSDTPAVADTARTQQ